MTRYDVVVIGGGPAGLMAAGRAAELDARVLLLEKNQKLGIKLLMTGGGRCNFTNNSPTRLLAEAYGVNGSWLLAGLSRFGPTEIIKFLEERGVRTRLEDGGRIFPQSNQASEILKVLTDYVKSNGTKIKTKSPVVKIIKERNRIIKVVLADQTEITATNFIIAAGGKSYPLSGSSGDAYTWLSELGHKVVNPQAGLCLIKVKENVKELEGLSLSGAQIKLYLDIKKISAEAGDFIFTSRGLSGPAALNLSRIIARQGIGNLKIKIDFSPDETTEDLDRKIQRLLVENKQMAIKNILSKLYPARLVIFALTQTKINPAKKGNGLTRLERKALVSFFKEFNLQIMSLGGFNEAMITVGGVDLKEVDPKTMVSKIISNLYLAGEVLNLDGPTGGYNLQIAWTTGYLAGDNAAK
ncbi:MAG: NAD(P)/FAD-dependent oxidoreductase [Patescibacteria group bacterium]|jgi:hypothetical protein